MATSTTHIGVSTRGCASRKRTGTSRATAEREALRAQQKPHKHVMHTMRTASSRVDAPRAKYKAALLTLTAVVVIVAMLYGPLRDYYVAWRNNTVLTSRYNAVLAENTQIQEDINELMTTEGIEDAARAIGYVHEGESTAVVRGIPEETTAMKNENVQGSDEPWYIGTLDTIFGYKE